MPAGLSARDIARALGGEARGRNVLAPGPGHSPRDRSLSVTVDDTAPDGFVVNSFAGDDPLACRDYVRDKAGLGPRSNGREPGATDRPIPVHPEFGAAHAVWSYRSADGDLIGVVCRWNVGDGKEILPAVPKGASWRWQAMPAPRPLYRLPRLAEASAGSQVVVVEGEKCADALAGVMGDRPLVTTWAGGSNAVAKTDWSPLAGHHVIIWPDADAPGHKAAAAIAALARTAGAASVRTLDVSDRPDKWDAADAVAGGMDRAAIIAWARSAARDVETDRSEAPSSGNVVSIATGETVRPDAWRGELVCNSEGKVKPRATQNFYVMIRDHPDMRGRLVWNDMRQEAYIVSAPWWHDGGDWQPRPIADDDVTRLVRWLEIHHLSPRPNEVLAQAVSVARARPYHPIRDYLDGLVWDGCPRLAGGMWEGDRVPHMPAEYMGAPADDIYGTFMTRWMVSAVARVMRPGCKSDCAIILEGEQGALKSTMLKRLATVGGVAYFTDSIHNIVGADAALQMVGIWIAEIAELNAFSRAEANEIKSWLSRETDRFRPPYGRVVVDMPRQAVIAGTLNPVAGYLNDPTGGRRFWPIPVGDIDLDRIEADRDQFWAEATAYWRRGERWYLTEAEFAVARDIVRDRYAEDPWDAVIDHWVKSSMGEVTMADIIRELAIPRAQQNQSTSRRIGARLRHLGLQKQKSRQSDDGYVWVRPNRGE